MEESVKSEPRPENVSCCVLLEHQAAENKEFKAADSKEFLLVFSFRQKHGLVNEKLADEASNTNGKYYFCHFTTPEGMFRLARVPTPHTTHETSTFHWLQSNPGGGRGGHSKPNFPFTAFAARKRNEKILSMKDKKT